MPGLIEFNLVALQRIFQQPSSQWQN